MGWAKSVTLFCDVCQAMLGPSDLSAETVAEAREMVRHDGHHLGRSKKEGRQDICFDCWEAGER